MFRRRDFLSESIEMFSSGSYAVNYLDESTLIPVRIVSVSKFTYLFLFRLPSDYYEPIVYMAGKVNFCPWFAADFIFSKLTGLAPRLIFFFEKVMILPRFLWSMLGILLSRIICKWASSFLVDLDSFKSFSWEFLTLILVSFEPSCA